MSSAIDEEEEILLSIFPEEFEKLNDNTFRIRLDVDVDECKVKSPPVVYLTTQLPAEYPEVPPILHLESVPSEAGDDLTPTDRDALVAKLNETSGDNLGMAMVFTLVSALKEEVILLLDERVESAERMKKSQQEAVQREEQRRFEGTKVTAESFNAWNRTFKLEMARRQHEEEETARRLLYKTGGASSASEKKLTGRQLFEGDTTLAQSDLKIGDASDVEFDFSKYDKTTRNRVGDEEEEEEEVRHWSAE